MPLNLLCHRSGRSAPARADQGCGSRGPSCVAHRVQAPRCAVLSRVAHRVQAPRCAVLSRVAHRVQAPRCAVLSRVAHRVQAPRCAVLSRVAHRVQAPRCAVLSRVAHRVQTRAAPSSHGSRRPHWNQPCVHPCWVTSSRAFRPAE